MINFPSDNKNTAAMAKLAFKTESRGNTTIYFMSPTTFSAY